MVPGTLEVPDKEVPHGTLRMKSTRVNDHKLICRGISNPNLMILVTMMTNSTTNSRVPAAGKLDVYIYIYTRWCPSSLAKLVYKSTNYGFCW